MYQFVLVLKFLGVMGFAGGAIAAFVSRCRETRSYAAHRIASVSLLAVWLAGYTLLVLNGWPFFELWIVVSVLLSIMANGVLAYCVTQDRRSAQAFFWLASPVVGIVVLMVLKPTWTQVLP